MLEQLLSLLPLVFELFDKIGFIIMAFFFGGISFKGWKADKNIFFSTIMTVMMGFICLFGGLILKGFLGWDFIFADYISSLILAFIIYGLLILVSHGLKKTRRVVTKDDIKSLVREIDNLKIQLSKVMIALEKKNLLPKPLSEEEVRESLKKELVKKNVKNYELLTLKKLVDVWECVIKTKRVKKTVLVESFSGKIVHMETIHTPLEFITHNPLTIIGFALFIVLLVFLGLNINAEAMTTINEAFDFSFLLPSGSGMSDACATTRTVLHLYNNTGNRIANFNFSYNSATSALADGFIVSGMTSAVRDDDGNDYFIIITYPEQVTKSELAARLSSNIFDTINGVRLCSMSSDYELCECIGEQQTDILLYKDYLLDQGILQDVMMNLLLGSLFGS